MATTTETKNQTTNGKKQSKTDAIREALKEHQSPSKVAELLTNRGISVSPQYVSTIKASDKKRASSGLPKRKPGRPFGSRNGKSPASATKTRPKTAVIDNGTIDVALAKFIREHGLEAAKRRAELVNSVLQALEGGA